MSLRIVTGINLSFPVKGFILVYQRTSMSKNNGTLFFMAIIALVTGRKLMQHADFQNWTFQKPALDTVYLIAFILSLIFIVVQLVKRKKE